MREAYCHNCRAWRTLVYAYCDPCVIGFYATGSLPARDSVSHETSEIERLWARIEDMQ